VFIYSPLKPNGHICYIRERVEQLHENNEKIRNVIDTKESDILCVENELLGEL
jgi:hypothetical protein